MGGSGIYSMVFVIAPGLVHCEKHGKYMAVVASVFAIASILWPIFWRCDHDQLNVATGFLIEVRYRDPESRFVF